MFTCISMINHFKAFYGRKYDKIIPFVFFLAGYIQNYFLILRRKMSPGQSQLPFGSEASTIFGNIGMAGLFQAAVSFLINFSYTYYELNFCKHCCCLLKLHNAILHLIFSSNTLMTKISLCDQLCQKQSLEVD